MATIQETNNYDDHLALLKPSPTSNSSPNSSPRSKSGPSPNSSPNSSPKSGPNRIWVSLKTLLDNVSKNGSSSLVIRTKFGGSKIKVPFTKEERRWRDMSSSKSYEVNVAPNQLGFNGKTYECGEFQRPVRPYMCASFEARFGFGCECRDFDTSKTVIVCSSKTQTVDNIMAIVEGKPINEDLTWFLLKILLYDGHVHLNSINKVGDQLHELGFTKVDNPYDVLSYW